MIGVVAAVGCRSIIRTLARLRDHHSLGLAPFQSASSAVVLRVDLDCVFLRNRENVNLLTRSLRLHAMLDPTSRDPMRVVFF